MAGLTDSLQRQTLVERAGHVFPSPWFDVSSQYVPRNIKDTFKWAEYLYMRNATYRSAVNRIVRYPITTIKISTEGKGEQVAEKYDVLFNRTLDMRTFLAWKGIDTQVYGNSFSSVYHPFDRWLKCPECGYRSLLKNNKTWEFKDWEFHDTCPTETCGYVGVHERVDLESKNEKRFNIIRWSPKEIDLNYNQWSGQYEYYWRPSSEMISKVEKGDKLILRDIPWAVVETIKSKLDLKFHDGMVFHLKEPSLSGINLEWGMPNCLPVFAEHYYIALLRRANEAIFLDYILPFRVLHPQAQQGGSADPTMFVSLGSFVGRMKQMVARHRRDPLDIQVSPIPVGYQTISGEAKALTVSEDLRMANEVLLNGLGFPAELFYGTLSIQAMPAALRLFENTWSYQTHGFDRFLQWVADKAAAYFMWEKADVSLEPVTLADDIEKKQIMLQFAASQSVAQSTAMATYGLDFKTELEKKVEDARTAMEVENDAQDLASAEEQMAASGSGGQARGQTPFDIHGKSQQIAGELLSMPYEMRKSEMYKLKQADQTLYAMVKQQMEEIRKGNLTMANQQAQMSAGGMPPPMM